MSTPTISVIVPVYNAKKYLHRCIDSILSQTFTDFELLLIDDGSKDKSGAICDEYAVKDNRVRVFHKENGGVSSARNLGLDNARGEWITFIDADDYLYDGAFPISLKGFSVDLIVGGYSHVYVRTGKVFNNIPDNRTLDIRKDAEYFGAIIGTYLTTPWCKLFKRYIIQNSKLRFCENLSYGEDTDFVFRYIHQINIIQFIPSLVYYYCDTENVVGKYFLNAQHFKKLANCTCRNFELLMKKTNVPFFEMRNVFLRDYSSLYLSGVLSIRGYNDFMKEAKAFKKEKCICFTESSKYKTIYVMLNHCPYFAYVCIRLYRLCL